MMPEKREVEMIPLREAVFCVGCGVITRAANGHCPACGGNGLALVHLAKILDRAAAVKGGE